MKTVLKLAVFVCLPLALLAQRSGPDISTGTKGQLPASRITYLSGAADPNGSVTCSTSDSSGSTLYFRTSTFIGWYGCTATDTWTRFGAAGAGGATIAVTALVLKGDGAGNGIAATAGTDYVVPAGNVATATALAANGTNCGVGNAARGVDASGNAENCFAPTASPFASTVLTDFSATAPTTSGQIPIYDSTAPNSAGGTGAFVPGDPLVQGVVAAGASVAAIKPVYIGGVDGSGNSLGLVLDAAGRITSNINGTVTVGSHAVTNAGTFAVQAAATEADGANVTLGAKADAKSTATDTTAITLMQVAKQISASVQAPPSQAVTNAGTFVVQAGLPTTVDTNSGLKSASTLRVVLATDQPALTNKLLVTPDSVALPANQSVNVNQVAGTAADTNSGVKSAGTLRVVLATDQPALTNKLLVTPDSVALPANQSVNINQINSVTPLMGTGNTGTGSPRMTLATDQVALTTAGVFSVKIDQTTPGTTNAVRPDTSGATGAAPPVRADLVGFIGSGATGGFTTGAAVGDTYKNINVSTATTTLLVTGVSGRQVRISALHMITAAANNVAFIEGTGATCGTGTAGMAGGTTAASGYNLAANGGIAFGSGLGTVMQTATTGDSVCVVTSAATQLSGGLQYTIY